MDVSRNSLLGELASDAASERTDFVVQATEQLGKFLGRNRDRIAQLGGLTLIDEDPDYLSVAPDGTFRVRSRFEDPDTGEWVSETEIVETPSELVELYNPGEVYAAFTEAAREAAGLDPQPSAAGDLLETAGVPPEETFGLNDDAAYASAADEWAAGQPVVVDADDDESAALALYNLALDFQERSQASEARLIDQFQDATARLSGVLGDLIIVDDEDERLVLTATGRFRAEVLPEDGDGVEGEWRALTEPEEIVEFYDPTDVFGDLADAIAEAFPSVAPDLEAEEAEEDEEELEVEVDAPEDGQRPYPPEPGRRGHGPSMRLSGAELVESREILSGTWLQAWHAPAIASGARAGQYVHVRTTEAGGLPLRRPYPLATTDAASGNLTIQVGGGSAAAIAWARALRPGDIGDLAGPLGRPFEVDPRSRHLLLVAEGPAIASLRLLIDEAVRDVRSVVLLYGAATASQVYPSSLLPDEVEYVVATADGSLGHPGSVAGLVIDFEAWADQAFAAGSPALLGAVARLATGRRGRLGVATLGRKRGGGRPSAPGSPGARRKAFLQVAVQQTVACAGGTCQGCAIAGATGGTQRACREGPVFASDELDWGAD